MFERVVCFLKVSYDFVFFLEPLFKGLIIVVEP